MASDRLRVLGITQFVDHYGYTSTYVYNGKMFRILLTDEPRPGYDDKNAVVMDYLDNMDDVSANEGTKIEDNICQHKYLDQAAHEIGEIVLPLLREFAPLPSDSQAAPEPKASRR